MSVLLFLLCACSATLAVPTAEYYALEEAELHFERFIQEHNKNYVDENEKQVRFQIFKDNLEKANRMNAESTHAVFGITRFMDLTKEEFVNTYTGLGSFSSLTLNDCSDVSDENIPKINAPESFDWREHNAVTRVKDQKKCGSCYAFSATGQLEGQYAIKHKKLIELSEQEIVDCDDLCHGCFGGLAVRSFTSLMKIGGIQAEESYPYVGENQKCSFDASKVAVKVINCTSYFLRSQETLKRLVYSVGPISVGVQGEGFQTYTGGILTDAMCDVDRVNHAVLIVGYGTDDDGTPYWLIKNSWGTKFGEAGYVRVQRGEDALSCGLMNPTMVSANIE